MQGFQFRSDLVDEYLARVRLDRRIKEHYRDRTVLVTGGAGGIGSNLIIALSRLVGGKGRVVVLDNLSAIKYPEPWNVCPLPNILFVKGDVRSEIDLKRVFHEDPTIVFHLAAFFANQNSVDYPEVSAEVDILGQIRLLEHCRMTKVERFVYASSGCAIYGSYPKIPISEDFISMHLTTPYQINKMVGEMYNNFYAHHYDMDIVNCRFFNSYGPGEVPGQYRNVIPNFIYWAMKGQGLPLTGTGEETRDFAYVLDLVQGLIKAGFYEGAVGENFNLASGKETRIIDMANMVNEVTGNTAPIGFRPRRKWDTKPRLLASVDKARKLIRYEPTVFFEEGFAANVKWFQDNWELIEKYADFPPGMSAAVKNGPVEPAEGQASRKKRVSAA